MKSTQKNLKKKETDERGKERNGGCGGCGGTLFAFGTDVALEGVHLDLNALVFALGLGGFATIDQQNDDRDQDQ